MNEETVDRTNLVLTQQGESRTAGLAPNSADRIE
jgi:hypothetical protein